jgi:hypothetical protein
MHCGEFGVWKMGKIVFPRVKMASPPNPDFPDNAKGDYEEARTIVAESPRGAAALLRLAVQELCVHLGEPGKNLNDDIGKLVAKGLPVKVQEALDAVRVIGNNAVHPGQIDLKDDPETAAALFGLVNFIGEKMISEPKHIEGLYGSLPGGALDQIKKRDGEVA